MTRILIGALSGLNHGGRRENCRSTWLADVKRFDNLKALFLLGSLPKATLPVMLRSLSNASAATSTLRKASMTNAWLFIKSSRRR